MQTEDNSAYQRTPDTENNRSSSAGTMSPRELYLKRYRDTEIAEEKRLDEIYQRLKAEASNH